MKDKAHDEVMSAMFCADPAYAEAIFAEVLRDGACKELDILVRQLRNAGDVAVRLVRPVTRCRTE